MGHDISYCSVCNEQIRWQDFQSGQAFKLENRSFCLKCSPDALRTLPKERVKEIFQNLATSGATPSRAAALSPSTPRATPLSSSTPRAQKAVVARPSPSRRWPLIAAGAAVLAAVALAVVLTSGGGEDREGPKAPPPRPAPAPKTFAKEPSPPPSAPAGASTPKNPPAPLPPSTPATPPAPSREEAAKKTFQSAREWAIANPSDMEGAIRRLQDATFQATGTPVYEDAKAELEQYRKRQREFFASELAPLEVEVKAACAQERFIKAIEILQTAQSRHPATEWQLMVGKRVRDINDGAFKLLDSLKEKALAARQDGNEEEVKALRARIAGWGVASMVADFKKALGD